MRVRVLSGGGSSSAFCLAALPRGGRFAGGLLYTLWRKKYIIEKTMDFTDFNLKEPLLKGLEAAGYTTCTPVQEQVLKTAQDGSDLYVQSQTGTGKTAAYLVAVIQEMLSSGGEEKRPALVMVPTRELAVQVEEEAKILCGSSGLYAFSFYGGVGYEKQIAALKKGVDIIIGTPGRLIDLNESRNLDLSGVGFLVIDEADRMFDMGFYPDLRRLLKVLPVSERRQTMLFSATLNSYVKNLAWEYTLDAKEITIEAENITVSEIDQELLHVSSDDKMRLLVGILKNERPASVIIFCNTKRSCEVVAKRLRINGIQSEFIIGDLPQPRRLKILNDFKDGKTSALVATDVAARGIDVSDLAMVINYDLPNEAENYVHRIGRTARAGKSGKAYTFCSEQDVYNLPPVERYIEMQIPARVAEPSQMLDDQSAGIYIRTEDWRDEDDDSRGGFRRGRDGRPSRRRRDGDGERRGYRERAPRGDSRGRPERRGDDGRGGKSARRGTQEDLSAMENLSFEDRMKIYKEKYANSAARPKEERAPYRESPSGGERRGERRGEKRGGTGGRYDGGGKSGGAPNPSGRGAESRAGRSSGGRRDAARTQPQPQSRKGGAPAEPAPNKGLIAKLRTLFKK